jgi:hypothetical protein
MIGAKQESNFTDPSGMLGDSHRRIERFLSVLQKLSSGRQGGALNEQEQQVAVGQLVSARRGLGGRSRKIA